MQHVRAQSEAVKIFTQARQASRIRIECRQFDFGAFEDMRALATRRCTSIEYALAFGDIEQVDHLLGRTILDRKTPFSESRQTADIGAFRKNQAIGKVCRRFRDNPRGSKAFD